MLLYEHVEIQNLSNNTNQSKCVYVSRPEKQLSISMCEGFLNLSTPPKLWTVSGDSFNYAGFSCMPSV